MSSEVDTPDSGTADARVVRTRHDVLGTTLRVLASDGWEALTHANLAQTAGYSRATLYKHWPTRTHLLLDAFRLLGDTPHHTPAGELRADLIAELTAFRDAIRDHGLDRAMSVLAEQARNEPEMAALRDELVRGGDRILRGLLAPLLPGTDLAVATRMLSGAIFYSALMYGEIPDDDMIAATVDVLLRGVGAPGS